MCGCMCHAAGGSGEFLPDIKVYSNVCVTSQTVKDDSYMKHKQNTLKIKGLHREANNVTFMFP